MKISIKSGLTLGVATVLIATASVAGNHASAESKAVAARNAQMSIIAYSIGVLGATAKGEMEFDQAAVNSAATNLNKMATLDPATLWIAGTEQGAVDGSRAKAEIWSDPDGFAAEFEKMASASAAIVGAADAAAVGAGLGALGGSCKACHEKYRGPKN